MSRFNNLETGAVPAPSRGETPGLKDDRHFLRLAGEARARGRYEQALRFYSRVLEYNAVSLEAWDGQAMMLIELGRYADARQWLGQALERFPNHPLLLAASAITLARLGDPAASVMLSDASLAGGEESARVWLARGDLFLSAGEPRAEYCLERAVALAPQGWEAPWSAARILLFHDRPALAAKFAGMSAARDAARSPAWLELGRAREQLGLAEPAREAYLRALELDRECPGARDGLQRLVGMGWWTRLAGRYRRFFTP